MIKNSVAITNADDVIDSLAVESRIDELETLIPEVQDEVKAGESYPSTLAELREELDALRELKGEAEGYCPDWHCGAQLIRDSHFVRYAEELADDCGYIDSTVMWPFTCIDWAKAAEELKIDYTAVDFDGVTYWVR